MRLDSDETASKGKEWLSFRYSFLPVLGWALAIGVPGIVLIALATKGFHVNLLALGLGIVGGTVTGVLLTAAAVAYFKVYVSLHGLRCFDFWGVYHEVAWSEIVAAKPINLLGLRFLRVLNTKSRMAIWLPMFLANYHGFREFVCNHVDESNPLVQELEKE
jgi:hypothetical protein